MYALFYRRVTEPEIIYDIDANKVLHGQIQQIKVLSNTRCLVDGVSYSLETTPRWQTLLGRPDSTAGDQSNYRIFCAEHASSNFQTVHDIPWLDTEADADLAMQNEMDFFYLMQKSEFIINTIDNTIYNASEIFDPEIYRKRTKFFADPFGMFVTFGGTTFSPNLVKTRDQKFLPGPLELALWTTMDMGSALFSPALGKIYYSIPDEDNFRNFRGVGLLLAPVNYGHWHAQNCPALFALKRLIDLGLIAESEVTIVAAQPEIANVDLLAHYLHLLNIRPKVFDPVKDGISAFSFDCTLLPSSCSVGAFHWSDFVARSLSLLRERAELQHRVLFISRVDVNNARGLSNEDEVLQALVGAGIPVQRVVAGKMSYREQRELFAQAVLVIGTHGGGLTNAIYGGPGCAVLELNCDILDNNRGWFHNLFRLMGHRYAAINFPSVQHAWWAPFRADPDLVVRVAKELLSGAETRCTAPDR